MNKYNSENVCKHNTISASVIANIRTLGSVASVFIGSVWCSFHFFFFFHKRLKNFIRNGSILKVYNDARSSLTSAVLICNSVWWKKKKKSFSWLLLRAAALTPRPSCLIHCACGRKPSGDRAPCLAIQCGPRIHVTRGDTAINLHTGRSLITFQVTRPLSKPGSVWAVKSTLFEIS